MIVIDCEQVPPEERFRYWARTMRNALYCTDVGRREPPETPFSGVAEAWRVADTMLGEQRSGAHIADRSAKLIAERQLGMFIVGLPRVCSIEVEFARFSPLRADAGELLVFDSDIEWKAETQDGADYQAILIPRQRLAPYVGESTNIRPRTVGVRQELHGMLRACFVEFTKLRDQSGPAAEGATQVLVHLISVVCGLHPGEATEVQNSISSARMFQASQYIAANLHNPALNAAAVARSVGISVRRLHALYEASGSTVTRHINSARLEHARQLLAVQPTRTVLEIALTSGYYSQSTFYRRFTDTFGVTPGEYRSASASLSRSMGDPGDEGKR